MVLLAKLVHTDVDIANLFTNAQQVGGRQVIAVAISRMLAYREGWFQTCVGS